MVRAGRAELAELKNDAVLEADWARIDERIEAAEAAIKARLQEFSQNHGGTPEENQVIVDAAKSLESLRTEVDSWRAGRAS
jgi:hypothetical protein